jgi:hypothetical protein
VGARRTLYAAGKAVPVLTECVLGSGTVAVFPTMPGTDTCAELGLAPPAAPGGAEEHGVVVQLHETLSKRLLSACLGQEEALALVRRELDRLNSPTGEWLSLALRGAGVITAPPLTRLLMSLSSFRSLCLNRAKGRPSFRPLDGVNVLPGAARSEEVQCVSSAPPL